MGSVKSKQRSDLATIKVCFDTDSRAFDANNPIMGVIQINSKAAIPAYYI